MTQEKKKRETVFSVLPASAILILKIGFALFFLEMALLVGFCGYMSIYDLDFQEYKFEVLMMAIIAFCSIAVALLAMTGPLLFMNIKRHRRGLKTYSPNKHGNIEDDNFYFSQGVNLMYVGLALYFVYMAYKLALLI